MMRTCLALSFLMACPLVVRADDMPQAHWAYRPVNRPPMPIVRGQARTAVDRFILAALEGKGQTLGPEAERLQLLRRVSFDLTGLPSTIEEMEGFLADTSIDAYERMVERYLASPHYGERWGKYWLDVAGYADSNGYFNADSDRPFAWRYRDYVIRAFNSDKPYDRFVTEQLAGDELAGYVPDGDITPAMLDPLVATHFLRNAPDGTGESDGNPDEVRTDRFTVLEGTVQIVMNALNGITIQCARCHRHKFEPIGQKEYYALQAIFFPAYNPARWKVPKERLLEPGTRAERNARRQQNEKIDRDVKELQSKLAAAAMPLRVQMQKERLKDLEVTIRELVLQAFNTPTGKRTAKHKEILKKYEKEVTVSDAELLKCFPKYASQCEQVKKTIAALERNRPPAPAKLSVFVETDPKPPVHHVLRRGQHNQPGDEVLSGVPASLCTTANVYRPEPPPAGRISTGRRTALARWLTSPEHPLFARVMVNRIWQYHFGTGLVFTPDNLGQSGAKPSHPELLDYLASEFVRSGWSIKAMHRLILHSAVYRQSSRPRDDLDRLDPDNRLLGRFPLRRLDAEALRDAMLLVAGEIDLRQGGPYVATRRNNAGVVEVPDNADGRRRSVYLQQRRTQVLTLLQLFDAPAMVATCSVRPTSTVPLQALTMLNSEFARARARGFARRLLTEAGPEVEKRLKLAFRLASGRPPLAGELESARQFLAAQHKAYAGQGEVEMRTWTDLCQMVLASNAFLYVE